MGYRVKVKFADLKDHKRLYHEGDKFPRDGFIVSDERIAELSSSDNLMGYPLIEKVSEEIESVVKQPKEKTSRRKVKRDAD